MVRGLVVLLSICHCVDTGLFFFFRRSLQIFQMLLPVVGSTNNAQLKLLIVMTALAPALSWASSLVAREIPSSTEKRYSITKKGTLQPRKRYSTPKKGTETRYSTQKKVHYTEKRYRTQKKAKYTEKRYTSSTQKKGAVRRKKVLHRKKALHRIKVHCTSTQYTAFHSHTTLHCTAALHFARSLSSKNAIEYSMLKYRVPGELLFFLSCTRRVIFGVIFLFFSAAGVRQCRCCCQPRPCFSGVSARVKLGRRTGFVGGNPRRPRPSPWPPSPFPR